VGHQGQARRARHRRRRGGGAEAPARAARGPRCARAWQAALPQAGRVPVPGARRPCGTAPALVHAVTRVKLTQPELATVLSRMLPRSQTGHCGSATSFAMQVCPGLPIAQCTGDAVHQSTATNLLALEQRRGRRSGGSSGLRAASGLWLAEEKRRDGALAPVALAAPLAGAARIAVSLLVGAHCGLVGDHAHDQGARIDGRAVRDLCSRLDQTVIGSQESWVRTVLRRLGICMCCTWS